MRRVSDLIPLNLKCNMHRYANRETIAEQLRTARLQAGLTQVELARKMRTKQPAISRAERGNIGSYIFAERFAQACGFALRFNHVSIEREDGFQISAFTPGSLLRAVAVG